MTKSAKSILGIIIFVLTILFTWDVATNTNGKTFGCQEDLSKLYREAQRNELSLCANLSTATSARWSFYLTCASLLILVITFGETRKMSSAASESSRAAVKAAEQAEVSNAQAREFAQSEQRPWVYFDDVKIKSLVWSPPFDKPLVGVKYDIQANVINKGKSIAQNVSASIIWYDAIENTPRSAYQFIDLFLEEGISPAPFRWVEAGAIAPGHIFIFDQSVLCSGPSNVQTPPQIAMRFFLCVRYKIDGTEQYRHSVQSYEIGSSAIQILTADNYLHQDIVLHMGKSTMN